MFLLSALVLADVQGQTKSIPAIAHDTGLIKADSLKAVIVTAASRPRMKGDTLEYNTEHIAMRPNATVEELLKRLPGLQIDADGTITYNGQKIQQLLVDGEDIFASDPAMVARNLDASKIARVQLLDRKSDEARFTGVDDGDRTKTLNLVLKESAKDGYSGKVEAAADTKGNYNTNGALAGFRDKEQFTAFGLASNIGISAIGANAGNSSMSANFLNGSPDALGASAGMGIPRIEAVALHYANSWNEAEEHLSTNYQYSHYFSSPVTTTQSLQTQPDSIYGQFQQSHSTNWQVQHWVYGTCDWTLNAGSAFELIFHGNNFQGQNQFGATGNSTFNDTLVNSSQRSIADRVSRQDFGANILWRIKVGNRADRLFSVRFSFTKDDKSTNGYLFSLNRFYTSNGTIQNLDTIDQRKQIFGHSSVVNGGVNFTEPVWTGTLLAFGYGFWYTGNRPMQGTFDRGDGKYQDMIDSLSSDLNTSKINQYAKINIQGKLRRFSYSLGNDWIEYRYRQLDHLTDSIFRLHYFSWAPRMSLNYTANSMTNFNFNYFAYTQQPTTNQLVPATNNSDPLHISLGNPALKPSTTHNFKLDFHRFKVWQVNLSVNLTLTNNTISTKTNTDNIGRQISEPVNVGVGSVSGLNFMVNRRILGFETGLYTAGTYSRTMSYVNADLSRNDVYSGGGGFILNKYLANRFALRLNANFTYFDQASNINPGAPIHYWSQKHQGSVTLFFIRGFDINTNAEYTWQEKTSAFAGNTSVLLWNAYISRNFLHDKLVAKFQFDNILNANAGITRTNAANVNTETSTNILGRYWMVSAAWHFDKKFKRK